MRKLLISLLTLSMMLIMSMTAFASNWGLSVDGNSWAVYYNSSDNWRHTHHDDRYSEAGLPFRWHDRREAWSGYTHMKAIYDRRWSDRFPGSHAYRWHDNVGFYHHGHLVRDAVFFYDDNDQLISVGYWVNGVFVHFRADHSCYESTDSFFGEVQPGAPGWHDNYDGDRWNHHTIALRSMANGKFVTAENGGNSPLIANRDWAKEWETFEIIHLGNQRIALRSVSNGKFVTVDNDGNSQLIANREWVRKCETFEIVYMGHHRIALKSMANGEFVCADNGGNSSLIANRVVPTKWETFEVIDN